MILICLFQCLLQISLPDAGVVDYQTAGILMGIVVVGTQGIHPDAQLTQQTGQLRICKIRIHLQQKMQSGILFQNGDPAGNRTAAEHGGQGIAAVFAALAPDDAEIPDADVFTAKGAEAFIKILEKLLSGDAQECDIPELWKNVSDEEKSAYVKLLEIISGDIPDNGELVSVFFSDNSEEETSEETVITVNDIVNAVVSEGLKLMADEKDADSEKEKAELEISPEAAAAYFAAAVPVRSDIQVQVSQKAVTAEAEVVSV